MIKVSEIFYSLQGEGHFVGVPSVFLRTFGCNFECRGFNMPPGQKTQVPEIVAKEYKNHPEWTLGDLPIINTGCDSYASWHKGFKDLSPSLSTEAIIDEIFKVLSAPRMNYVYGKGTWTDKDVIDDPWSNAIFSDATRIKPHLVVTGGEPLLGWQKQYPDLLDKLHKVGFKYITFETNGTKEIVDDLHDYLLLDQIKGHKWDVTFSVSPKLPCSGEIQEDALKPEVVESYQQYGRVYLKFVVASEGDIFHVEKFVRSYRDAGFNGDVYLMPCGGDAETYHANSEKVSELCLANNYKYSPRLHVDIWGNQWAT
jgi:organic radical activating enzyme